MKKTSLYLTIALAGLFMGSCSDDYTDWANPQTNPQEDAITIPGFSAAAAQAIDLAQVTTDSVAAYSLGVDALPAGFSLENARMELTPKGIENATTTTVNTSLDGNSAVADLAPIVEAAYGKRPTARTFNAHVYVNAVKDGQAVLIDAGNVDLVMTPNAPFIDSNYYIVGNMTGWALDNTLKFAHSAADVYEDPNFTIMFTTTADNQYWKIIPQGNVDKGDIWAVENDPKGVVGVEIDGDDAMSGTLLTTTSTGEKANAGKIAKAGIYQMTINMMDYSYTIKQIAPEYYLVGKLQGWATDNKYCLMYAESAMIQSYTTQWNEDANLKIWLSSDWGNWDNAYGTATDGDNSASGNIGGSGAIKCPEPGAFYTFKVDFSTMTYSWTKLANQTPTEFAKIGLIGVGGDWTNDIDMKQVTPHNWYIEKDIPAGGLKIRANHEWNNAGNWGLAGGQEYANTGKLISDGGSQNIPVPAGKYKIFFNDITGEYAFIAE